MHAEFATSVSSPPTALAAAPRKVVHRTRGQVHGPIRRMFSPGDLGQLIKPFVFLDHAKLKAQEVPRFGLHPHSGIATLTFTLEGEGFYEETTGKKGILETGDIEWMVAGGGVWHIGGATGTSDLEAFQLWVALPPELENGPSYSQHIRAAEVPQVGPARVLLGRYDSASNPATSPPGMTYLAVSLRDGETWTYEPPAGHDVAWVMVHRGSLLAGGSIEQGELAVFAECAAAIAFTAAGPTGFVLGSAVKHPHALSLGNYSVHTSPMALERGEAGIHALATELRRTGKL